MKIVRAITVVLLISVIVTQAQLPERYEFESGTAWVKFICTLEMAGAQRNPPFEVRAYQYALSMPAKRGMIKRCYVQHDPQSYARMMELAQQYTDKNMSMHEALKDIGQSIFTKQRELQAAYLAAVENGIATQREAEVRFRRAIDDNFIHLDEVAIYAFEQIVQYFPGLESMRQMYDFLVKKGEKAELLQKI